MWYELKHSITNKDYTENQPNQPRYDILKQMEVQSG